MSVSDDLVESDAERACLDELRKVVGAADGPIERHSVRVFLLAEELARRGRHTCDRELVPQWWRGVEVELIRRGDLVEVTHGLVLRPSAERGARARRARPA